RLFAVIADRNIRSGRHFEMRRRKLVNTTLQIEGYKAHQTVLQHVPRNAVKLRFARQEGQQPIVQPFDEMVAIHRRPRITKTAMKPAKATAQNIGFPAPWQNIEAMFTRSGNHAFVGGSSRRSGERLFGESYRADAHSFTSPQ